MRAALLAVLLLAPLAAATERLEPYVVLLDTQEGSSPAGTTAHAAPLAARFPFEAGACHPHLLLDLLYDPAQTELAAPGVGSLALSHEFQAEVWDEDARVLARRVTSSNWGHPLGTLPGEGAYELRLWLTVGAAVDWEARLRGRLAFDDPACNPPPEL